MCIRDSFKNLIAVGKGGLEHFNGDHICEEYICSYACKGGELLDHWQSAARSITDEYCERIGSEDRSLRSLIGKHMVELTNGESVVRDHTQFLLGGGQLTRNSMGTPRRCSVNQLSVDHLESTSRSSFVWNNVEYNYKRRPVILEDINLYKFCANYWPGKNGTVQTSKPVQFLYLIHISEPTRLV